MIIKTNNQYRDILTWDELTTKEKKEIKDDYDSISESSFFRYKNRIWDLNELICFDHLDGRMAEWDGGIGLNYFGGVIVKLNDDGGIKVGTWVSD